MKIRNGFVSNSSSSSFIVIRTGNKYIPNVILEQNNELDLNKFIGEYEFGWQYEKYYEIESKINFAFLQSKENINWRKMLENVLKKNFKASKIIWNENVEKNGYIDHQSSSSEGMNTEMFHSEDFLENFIFSTNSFIQNANDNE